MKYRCKNCNYLFERKDLNESICPNCGEKHLMKEKSADELLEEI
jgi:DNA-directed RNA polymerase subunit RPC12/RpoP